MGAWIRIREKGIERKLRKSSQRGVLEPSKARLSDFDIFIPGVSPEDDTRVGIPALGLREYWYPAIPVRRVGRKPLHWTMLGDEVVLFRGKDGDVAALSDVCPHRGASLSLGDCFYAGTVTCPYHGATFNAAGECVAWLTEGPDSRMPGEVAARRYPTRVLKGWVFMWMGEGPPAPIEEDVPPEFFEPETTVVLSSYTYWRTNWLIAIENQNDSHNCDFVHRNSVKQFLGLYTGRARTPIGPKSRVINDRAVVVADKSNQEYYGDAKTVRGRMYYPGVEGVWPLYRVRRLWQPFFNRIGDRMRLNRFYTPDEWGSAHHLPCQVRVNYGRHMYTRYAVPVEANLSRNITFHTRRLDSLRARVKERLYFRLVHNWLQNYNFSGMDSRVASPSRYWTPENLSPTDSHLVQLRRLIRERSRDARRKVAVSPGKDGGAGPDDGASRTAQTAANA
jgi:phenylpropionate dioxygenase-like ring-hydroxylating dioxygenase large terminal subunit